MANDARPPDSLLSAVLGALHCGVVVHGRDGSIESANAIALALLGLTEAQILGRDSFDPRWFTVTASGAPFHPSGHPAEHARTTGKPVTSVVMGVARPGHDELVWLLVSAQPLLDKHQQVERVVVTFADISEQRALQVERDREHALLDEIMSTVLAGILVLDPEGTIRFANRRAEELLELHHTGTQNRTYNDPHFRITTLAGEPFPPEALPFARVRATKAPVWDVKHFVEHPTGDRRLLSVNGAPILDGNGELRSLVFALHDLTASDAVQREKVVLEDRLALAARAADLALVEWVVNGPLRIDEAWLRRRGWGDGPIPNTVPGWREVLAPADLALINAARDEHFAGHKPSIDVEFRLPMAKRVVARLVARGRAPDSNGRLTLVTGILFDVTAEVEAAERERALHQRTLDAARFDSVARVTGGVAHDFNNLLMGILGATAQASDALDDAHPACAHLDAVQDTAQRAAGLTRELLAISGHGRFHLAPLDLGQLCRELMPLANLSTLRRGSLNLTVAPHLPFVEGDAGQLRQLLLHLISNADESLPYGRGKVNVRVMKRVLGPDSGTWVGGRVPQGDAHVCVTIDDNGHGADPDSVSKLFQPFFTTREGHRGLGLSAVLGMVLGHRGCLSFDSSPGEGTFVLIGLPAVPPPAPAPAPPPRAPFQGTARLLVVDDEPVVLSIVTRKLQSEGFDVTTATNGAEALKVWHDTGPYDAVVSDLSMPVMDGEGLVRALRSDHPNLPILLLSGYSRSEVIGRMVGAGAVEFLAKPFAPRQLVTAIQLILSPDPPAQ